MKSSDLGAPLRSVRKIQSLAILGLTLICLVGTTACNRNSPIVAQRQALMVTQAQRAGSAHSSLSREHSVTVEVAESALQSSFQRLSIAARRIRPITALFCNPTFQPVSLPPGSSNCASTLVRLRT